MQGQLIMRTTYTPQQPSVTDNPHPSAALRHEQPTPPSSPQARGAALSHGVQPLVTGCSPQSRGAALSHGVQPSVTGCSPQSRGASLSHGVQPSVTGCSPQSRGAALSHRGQPSVTGGSPQSRGAALSHGVQPLVTGCVDINYSPPHSAVAPTINDTPQSFTHSLGHH